VKVRVLNDHNDSLGVVEAHVRTTYCNETWREELSWLKGGGWMLMDVG